MSQDEVLTAVSVQGDQVVASEGRDGRERKRDGGGEWGAKRPLQGMEDKNDA